MTVKLDAVELKNLIAEHFGKKLNTNIDNEDITFRVSESDFFGRSGAYELTSVDIKVDSEK